ncbi:DegT/DnrJ/EryC1/StrS family aminotransferase [Helicobacter sp. MIT 11-5569]|uniref:DegT/DnrJ/EryC1/StrS family aminotransferase n=1 Tax=Helicobacter sp. MIT 11-5569 TaxID=1548151 RepID=UPI00051FAF9D|nr:DegT/DnrJ/EryC1/StrS family aminotransferase [Helicobacter sp. MIT 11-5569]TLD81370.1 DegT/DnrJ/EryC1/StrS family aminotransferase [Helicobacter sp. MIT 11-5569]
MKIDFANLKKAHLEHKAEVEEAVLRICRNANYIMGDEVESLEQELAEFTNSKYAITCSSGSSALLLALMALDLKAGDEVITTPFTFIATAEMIALLGIKPVFVDISLEDYNLDCDLVKNAITPKTKAILAVSLYGQPPNIEKLEQICKKENLKLIIDGAQSFGSEFHQKKDSSLGTIATTSFFPAKPLGCYGDGGAVFTQEESLAKKIASLRLHGQKVRYIHQYIGIGGRLDAIQAAILRIKLRSFAQDIARRNQVAKTYDKYLRGSNVILPKVLEGRKSVFAQYTIRTQKREALQEKLKQNGIPSAIHYPLGLHLQECFANLGYKKGDFPNTELASAEVLSLPMNPYLSESEIKTIAQVILDKGE